MAVKRVLLWLSALEIDVTDLERWFKVLDNGEGTIEFPELFECVRKLKVPLKSMDMVMLSPAEGHQRDR